MPKSKNGPLTRETVRRVLGDGRWRTMSEIVILLRPHVPTMDAVRQAETHPGLMHLSIEDKADRGIREFAVTLINGMVTTKQARTPTAERDSSDPKRVLYRVLPEHEISEIVAEIDANKPEPVVNFNKPADTESGLSRHHITYLIKHNPGISLLDIVYALSACFRPDAELEVIAKRQFDGVLKEQVHARGRLGWIIAGMPRPQVVRTLLVYRLLQQCIGSDKSELEFGRKTRYNIRAEMTIRYYPVTADEK